MTTAVQKRVSLYEMADAYNEVFMGLRNTFSDDEAEQAGVEDALVQQLNDIEGSMESKMANVARFLLNLEWEAEGVMKRVENLRALAKRMENASSRLRQMMLLACEATGRDKWEVPGAKIARTPNSQASVEVPSLDALPDAYKKTTIVVTPDKRKIADDVKAGLVVPGAIVTRGHHIRVKEA